MDVCNLLSNFFAMSSTWSSARLVTQAAVMSATDTLEQRMAGTLRRSQEDFVSVDLLPQQQTVVGDGSGGYCG
jgi:hypothetical protein